MCLWDYILIGYVVCKKKKEEKKIPSYRVIKHLLYMTHTSMSMTILGSVYCSGFHLSFQRSFMFVMRLHTLSTTLTSRVIQ